MADEQSKLDATTHARLRYGIYLWLPAYANWNSQITTASTSVPVVAMVLYASAKFLKVEKIPVVLIGQKKAGKHSPRNST